MYELGVLITTGEIVYIRGSYPGSQNNWRMHRYYNMAQYLLPGKLCLVDLGYLGFPHMVVLFKRIFTNMPLSPEQAAFNEEHGSYRVIVENTIGQIKTFKCIATTFRHDLHDHATFFNVCAQLTNIRLRVNPLHQEGCWYV